MNMFRFAMSIASAALAAVAVCPAVHAADIQGVIKEINTQSTMVTLEDGTELRIDSQDLLAKIREGDKVMVSFEEKDGQKVVSSVEVTGK
jgi:Cu/Ag efflux protein CusF